MTNSKRQPYGFGSFVKKITRPVKKIAKKVIKSPLGKAALIGGGLYGLGGAGFMGGKGIFTGGQGLGRFANIAKAFGKKGALGYILFSGKGADRKFSLGKLGLAGLLGAGVAMPFMGGDDEEEIIEEGFDVTPSSIANIRNMARNRDPSLAFLPRNEYFQSGYYLKDGGLAKLANGGGVAEAQAEQMLKMQYQKYRNQGGTMSYQQFKMTVLKQAQDQGPMAQEHLQRAAKGGRIGYNRGRVVNPGGYAGQSDLSDRYSLYPFFKDKQISDGRMISPPPGDISGILEFMKMMAKTRNKAKGGRIGADEGGLMDLGGMEKDYRQEGGFVPLGKKEKADDVPARLSKNEFVFTADAVRNAGGGDIDAGAEVMENMMNHLESGGEISEEEIVEGPNGAQEMYDQQQMLQSRMG